MKNDFIGIDDNRLLHIRAVGKKCYSLSRHLFSWDDDKCKEMYTLGYLHDFGYEFSSNQSDHEEIGGKILKSCSYKYWREVYLHGNPDPEYWSNELLILNIADMQTSKDGAEISVSERLTDIQDRYGEDSSQYINAKKLSEKLYQELKKLNIEYEL